MEFGILFTSHPNHATEPYPHRDVHARVTAEIQEAERLGYDTAWIAEHHFSNQYGIMPDCFAYMGYLAGVTSRIRIAAGVITLPLYDPVRVVENTAFVDILSGGRITLGIGSGYRPYEFSGMGRDFEARREVQDEAIDILLQGFHDRRIRKQGQHFDIDIGGEYELLPVAVQEPHPPLFMAGGTERSIGVAGRHGFGLMLSTLPGIDTLASHATIYRENLAKAPARLKANPAAGSVDIARWVYVAETDEIARAESEEGILRHLGHFTGNQTAGYLGSVSEKGQASALDYADLARTTLVHGSPETVIAKLRELQQRTGMTSLLLHYPPYYGRELTFKSLRLFAERVMPAFRPERAAAE